MPVTVTLMNTCRALVDDLPELATFRVARAAFAGAPADQRLARWKDCFDDSRPGQSPHAALKKAIRDTVISQSTETENFQNREFIYQTLVAEYASRPDRPKTDLEQNADLLTLASLTR